MVLYRAGGTRCRLEASTTIIYGKRAVLGFEAGEHGEPV
jgi:hypothetical protein